MEQFTKLSISDDQDQDQDQDKDALTGILHLSISDPNENNCTDVNIRKKHTYMPYFPTSPSPLRHSLSLVDSNSSSNDNNNVSASMDIDPEEDDGNNNDIDTEMLTAGTESQLLSNNNHVGSEAYSIVSRSTPSIDSIKKWENSRAKDVANELQDIVVSDGDDGNNSERKEKLDRNSEKFLTTPSMLKALLSPTKLGVAAATTSMVSGDKQRGVTRADSNEIHHNDTITKGQRDAAVQTSIVAPVPVLAQSSAVSPQVIPQLSSTSSVELLKNELRSRSRDQPIHVSVNNHNNYYYNGYPYLDLHTAPSPPRSSSFSPSSPSSVPSSTALLPNFQRQPQWDPNDQYTLPYPWSPTSKPASRYIYNYVSYLQLALNTLTTTLVIFYTGKIIKADLNSLWYTDRQLLINESNYCKKQYTLNRCSENYRLPALSRDCESWLRCMQRDNELAFGNRSVLMMGLFGRLINSFVEPIGYKAAVFLVVGVCVWCFSSNFLLGFLRARYYYYGKVDQGCEDRRIAVANAKADAGDGTVALNGLAQ